MQGLSDTDNDWYRARSLITSVDKIKVPIHIVGAYQDEQTGPRGQTHLFEQIGGVSHRAVDDSQSDHTPDGRIYRPYRPHTNPTNITPGQTYEYLVEVWPVGHVFRTGTASR